MKKIKVLFFIKNLGGGGAEKVLINLLHRMDKEVFDITLHTIFDEGLYKDQLPAEVSYKSSLKKEFRGFVFLQKMFSPRWLHRFFIKASYDLEIAFLEGVCTRIVSGAYLDKTKIISWLHTGPGKNDYVMFKPYRSKAEMQKVYGKFDQVFAVSEYAATNLNRLAGSGIKLEVRHNVIEKDLIQQRAVLPIDMGLYLDSSKVNFCSVGRLTHLKGFMRVIESLAKIKQQGIQDFHYFIIGEGEQKAALEKRVADLGLQTFVSFLGFQENPYSIMQQMDWFVCSSYYEGFSSVVCEALIVQLPVFTTDCSGMEEILGKGNEYGIICENTDTAICHGLMYILKDPSLHVHYKAKAEERISFFDPALNASEVAKKFIEIASR